VFAMPGDVDRASSEGWTDIYWSAVAAGTFAVGTCLAPKPGIGGPEGRSSPITLARTKPRKTAHNRSRATSANQPGCRASGKTPPT
jgi:hypothetical protein